MRRVALASAVAALAFSSVQTATAADMPVKAPPLVVVTSNWAGVYLGGNIGGAWLRASEGFVNDANLLDPLTFSASSVIGGGQVGIQGQWGNWVLGLEGTFSVTNLNQTVPSINPGGPARAP